jgi:hypothetical protein
MEMNNNPPDIGSSVYKGTRLDDPGSKVEDSYEEPTHEEPPALCGMTRATLMTRATADDRYRVPASLKGF